MRQSPGRHGGPPGRQSKPASPRSADRGADRGADRRSERGSGARAQPPPSRGPGQARPPQRGPQAGSERGSAYRQDRDPGARGGERKSGGERPAARYENAKRAPYAGGAERGAEPHPDRRSDSGSPYRGEPRSARDAGRGEAARPARADARASQGRDRRSDERGGGRADPRSGTRPDARRDAASGAARGASHPRSGAPRRTTPVTPRTLNVRATAARAISRVLRGSSLDDALMPADRYANPADAAMAQLIAYGVLRELSLLQALVSKLLDKPLPQDDEIHALLLVGVYQLRMLKTPEHAAIHETVAAVEVFKRPQAAGLVNAVLRRYTRDAATLESRISGDAAVRYSHPAWLVQRIKTDWPQQWEALLAANNEQGPLTLRVNRRRITRDAYLQRLAEMQIEASAVPQAPDAVQLATPRAVEKIPGFATGQVSVQDASAQLAVELLDLRDGQRVLDACAAPGGKTAHQLERADLELIAIDSDAQRLIRVDENLRRLKLSAKIIAGDAAEPQKWWDRQAFDRILLDAPCSATGVIRRHPDIKWLRRDTDISALQAKQLQLLKACWTMLKPGGRLVYATCSVLSAEGDDVVNRFRLLHDDVQVQKIEAGWGEAMQHGRRLMPGGSFDGFYYAVLDKA